MDNSGATSKQPTKYTQCAGECLAQHMGHGNGHLGEVGQNFAFLWFYSVYDAIAMPCASVLARFCLIVKLTFFCFIVAASQVPM